MDETDVIEVTFGDNVIAATVTSSGDDVEAWLAEVRAAPSNLVGLDVEWRPCRRADENPVATLQLCVGRRCLIFQLLHADRVPRALVQFLGDRGVRFVGVGVGADAERLSDDHELVVANAVDLRGLAAEGMGRPELRQAGLRAIVAAVMGVNLVKPQRVTMSRWDASCLSYEQIRYACIDAFVSFEVGRRLLVGEATAAADPAVPAGEAVADAAVPAGGAAAAAADPAVPAVAGAVAVARVP
jgi:ribonuclease D